MKTTKKSWQLLVRTRRGIFQDAIIEDYGQDVITEHIYNTVNYQMDSITKNYQSEDDLTYKIIYKCAFCDEITYLNEDIIDIVKNYLFSADVSKWMAEQAFTNIRKYLEVMGL